MNNAIICEMVSTVRSDGFDNIDFNLKNYWIKMLFHNKTLDKGISVMMSNNKEILCFKWDKSGVYEIISYDNELVKEMNDVVYNQ